MPEIVWELISYWPYVATVGLAVFFNLRLRAWDRARKIEKRDTAFKSVQGA